MTRRQLLVIATSNRAVSEPIESPTLRKVIARGNVRELANVMERAVILAQRPEIDADDRGAIKARRRASLWYQ